LISDITHITQGTPNHTKLFSLLLLLASPFLSIAWKKRKKEKEKEKEIKKEYF
jgi:hypothetical protein